MEKRAEFPKNVLLAALATGKMPDESRIVWRQDNIIYLATKETLIDVLTDTNEPEKFEVWMPSAQEKDLKN